jgi:adenosylmethionine-8-amino-7-oxononanoate aminotransferase
MHGPTYMGNPLACAAANASLDLFATEPRLAQVAHLATRMTELLAQCRDIQGVRDVRVLGAIGVVELGHIANMNALKRRLVDAGAWIRPFGNIAYLTPAFTITDDELACLAGAITSALAKA